MLKLGATFRVTVPDLAKYVAFYGGQLPHKGFRKFGSGAEAIWALTQNWGHVSCWDAGQLGARLAGAGFKNIKVCAFREGGDSRLIHDSADREWESLYMEGQA